jgi:regulatory protein
MRSGQPPLSLKARALAYLSAREHSRSELRAKLLRPARPKPQRGSVVEVEVDEPDPDVQHSRASEQGLEQAAKVDAVLDELEALKYLSDERFVESLAHRRASRFGVLKLRHELKSHKIAEPLQKEALERARSSELERATDVWSKKFMALPESVEERAKQQRFLANRGFTPSVVYKVLKGRVSEED